MNKRDREKFRKLLLTQREALLGNAQRALSGDIHVDPDDFPDEMDTASSEVNLQFTGRLREREQGLLAKIDTALEKIEQGELREGRNAEKARLLAKRYFDISSVLINSPERATMEM